MGKWNWQYRDWPNFTWDRQQTQARLPSVYHKQGYVAGLVNSLNGRRALITKALTENIVASFAIEGEYLDATDVSNEIERGFGQPSSYEKTKSVGLLEGNAAALISNIFDKSSEVLTPHRLGVWQRCMFERTYSSAQIGQPATWRTEDIQVVSGGRGNRKIHFEAPGPLRVPIEMEAFLKWFFSSRKSKEIDPVSRAALAHLWFVTVHPFEDGNGRSARAVADLALFQSDKNAVLYPMAPYILADRENYYRVLERTQSSGLDVTEWMIWFFKTLENALDGAITRLSWSIEANNLVTMQPENRLLTQQVRILVLLHDDADQNVISASQYAAINSVSKATATRHLTDLVDKGYLCVCEGRGRSTKYRLSDK
ncbi:Fic family protein [Thalassospira lucentensis]|uniref:Fic family protein n=1 Tax=Thalassospira lucentensis TaxID=168935 RepID=UPI003D2ED829